MVASRAVMVVVWAAQEVQGAGDGERGRRWWCGRDGGGEGSG
jgi:hypothetical protein